MNPIRTHNDVICIFFPICERHQYFAVLLLYGGNGCSHAYAILRYFFTQPRMKITARKDGNRRTVFGIKAREINISDDSPSPLSDQIHMSWVSWGVNAMVDPNFFRMSRPLS